MTSPYENILDGTYTGTSENELFDARNLSGYNLIFASDGNDYISAGYGGGFISGGKGTDIIDGHAANDLIYGDLDSFGSKDVICGDMGNDSIFGDAGNDYINGGSGNDSLYGGKDNDILLGGWDTDTVYGEDGADVIYGAAPDASDPILDAAKISITLFWDGIKGHFISSLVIKGTPGILPLTWIMGDADILDGGNGNDEIHASNGANTLIGGEGDDALYGGYGSDTMQGGRGSDYLNGSSGADNLSGGLGSDTYIVDSYADKINETADVFSVDVVKIDLSKGIQNFGLKQDSEVETIFVINASQAIDLSITGSNTANKIIGTSGANQLFGLGGEDNLQGGVGNDFLYGDDGNDFLVGGSGIDELRGGKGDDTYLVGDAKDVLYEASGTSGGMHDELRLIDSAMTNSHYALKSGVAIEEITMIFSGNGSVTGNGYAQTINGTLGANFLAGLGGDDVLLGLGANDLLNGGTGHDTLTGGDGADAFVFDQTFGGVNLDSITDFKAVDDVLYLDNAVFKEIGPEGYVLNPMSFVEGKIAKDSADRIVYDRATGELFYDADGAGSIAQVRFAVLDNRVAITFVDFLVI